MTRVTVRGCGGSSPTANKRTIALDLKHPDDLGLVLDLAADADVVVENFRPGTLERLGLGPEALHERNPRLVVTRLTGFGQTGPYAGRAGFATIAEAMSGWAALNGEPDGQPLLPPIALTDEVTGLAAAFATLVALHSGVGQVVDISLLETMFQLMGPLVSLFALTGEQQARLGAGLPYTVPRGTYQCSDGRWIAVSASSESVARRLLDAIGLGDDERFTTFAGRERHRAALDAAMAAWCRDRPSADVVSRLTTADAAVGPVMDFADIADDPHFLARRAIIDACGTPMQNVIARLSATPGRVRRPGPGIDADGDAIRRDGWGGRGAQPDGDGPRATR